VGVKQVVASFAKVQPVGSHYCPEESGMIRVISVAWLGGTT
jgi:hypothetical protein